MQGDSIECGRPLPGCLRMPYAGAHGRPGAVKPHTQGQGRNRGRPGRPRDGEKDYAYVSPQASDKFNTPHLISALVYE